MIEISENTPPNQTSTGSPHRPLVSIIVPVYNEEENVRPFYDAVAAVAASLDGDYRFEFIFTDNHSEDRTFEILGEIADRDPRVCVYRFSRNFGFQNSIFTGYMMARGDAAIQIDCDLQDPPALIADFLRQWRHGYQVVYGVRRSRSESPLASKARNAFYRLIDKISERHLPHDAGDFRLIDRRVIDELAKHHDRSPYLRGIVADIGFRQIGIAYDRASRQRGRSKFNLISLVNLGIDGIVSHSMLPLRISLYSGLIIAALCVAVSIGFTIYRFFGDYTWPAGFVFLSVGIMMSLAINMIIFGVFGEYIGRIHKQVVQKPMTIVDRIIDRREDAARWITRLDPRVSTDSTWSER